MPYAKARDGTKLYYKDWGRGDPIVLLHGWPLTADTWDDAAIRLAEAGHRCIMPDRRGFGRSDQPWDGHDYDTYADDVAAVLDHAGISEPVSLVGFSMGGGEVARFLTKQGKSRVRTAVLISSVVPYMPQTDDNPDGVPQSTFDQMTEGMKEDRAHFFKGFFKDFFGTGFISQPVSNEVEMNAWRQTMMAGPATDPRRRASLRHDRFPSRHPKLRWRADADHPRHVGQDGADRRDRAGWWPARSLAPS